VQCSAVQYSTVQCSAGQGRAGQGRAGQCSAVQCRAGQGSAAQYITVQYSTVENRTISMRGSVWVNWNTAVCGGIVWDWQRLGVSRIPRKRFTQRLPSDIAQHSTFDAQCCVCDLDWGVLCVVCGRRGIARSGSAFSGCNSNFHEKATFRQSRARSADSAVCANYARTFCVWSVDDVVLLEAVRLFPATTRTFTKWLFSDTRPTMFSSACVN